MDGFDQFGYRGPIEAGATFKDALGSLPGAVAGLVLDGHRLGHRVTVACDGHAFALGDTVEKSWQR